MKKYITIVCIAIAQTISAQLPPEPPTIRYVSQDPLTDMITIAWYKSISPNVVSLYIEELRDATSGEQPELKIYSINQDDSYTFSLSELKHPTTIKIALNVTVTKPSNGFSAYHSPAQIENIKFNDCPPRLDLTWSDYRTSATSSKINGYTIYKIENGTGIPIYSAKPSDTHAFTYKVTDLGKQEVCFYVETDLTDSKGVSCKATSGKKCGTIIIPRPPKFIRANSATTLDSNNVQLSFTLDTACDIKHYRLYSSDTIDGTYKPIAGADFAKITSPSLQYTDNTINANKERRFYKRYLIGTCGDQLMCSNVASNMVLTVNQGDRLDNILDWTAYHDFTQGVKTYHIYKTIDNREQKLVDDYLRLGKEMLQYTEDGEADAQLGAKVCYIIIAEENSGTFPAAQSTSNQVCIQRQDRVFMPDAFNPYSATCQNKSYKPSMSFVSNEGYEFKIIDRWGGVVFKTNDTQQAWDGKVNNEIVPPGTFVYQLRYRTATGGEIVKKGTFNVIY